MRLPLFPIACALTLAAATAGAAAARTGPHERDAATATHARSSGQDDQGRRADSSSTTESAARRGDSDHDGHRDRGRDFIVFDDDVYDDSVFWDPVWGWYGPWGPWYGPEPSRVYIGSHKGLVPVELHVHPWKASVFVDTKAQGEARDYNDDSHPLWLRPGSHVVALQYPGYQTLRLDLDVEKGLPRDLHFRLVKGKGLDPRSQGDGTEVGG